MTDKGVAFLVGIDDYDDPSLTPFAEEEATKDVNALKRILDDNKEYSKYKLYDDNRKLTGRVTLDTLNSELQNLFNNAKHKDILIYFSGHGYQIKKNESETGYLATSNCKLFCDDKHIVGENKGLSFKKLGDMIVKASPGSIILLLDACHSGHAIEKNIFSKTLESQLNSGIENYCIIASSLSGQNSYFKEGKSLFTQYLIEKLEIKNGGKIYESDLFNYINEKLNNERHYQNCIRFIRGEKSLVLMNYPGSEPSKIEPILGEDDEPICPYKGFNFFNDNETDANFFFGREKDIRKIGNKLNDNSFILVIGASGSGKSSVVRAGLIQKQLRQEEKDNWIILPIIEPGNKPLQRLNDACYELQKNFQKTDRIYNLIDDFKQTQLPIIEDFKTILEELQKSQKNQKTYLLVIDQFEEVFTLNVSKDEVQKRDCFLELVTSVSKYKDSPLKVVVTMRDDFFPNCLNHTTLNNLNISDFIHITPLVGQGLRDAIEKPAARQGYPIEQALLDHLERDVINEPGSLPLLEFTLQQLWQEKDKAEHLIPLSAYSHQDDKALAIGETKKISGLKKFVNIHADKVYEYSDFDQEKPESKRPNKEREWIRLVFLRLVRTGRENTDTRERRPLSHLLKIVSDQGDDCNELQQVIESLIRGRLLVSNQSNNDQREIDLAHEALIDGWQQFVKWRDQAREFRRLAQRLEDARQEWQKASEEQKKGNLMQGALLAQVREELEKIKPFLADQEDSVKFYELSDANDKEEKEKLKQLLAEKIEALTEAKLRESAARVQNLIPTQPLDALLLAIETVKTNLNRISEKNQISEKELIPVKTLAKHPGSILGVVQASLSESVARAIVPNVCEGHQEAVKSVAFSSEGEMIVSSTQKMAYFWDSSGKTLLKELPLCKDKSYDVNSIAFSSKSRKIVGGCSDNIVRVWSFEGELLYTLQEHQKAVKSVAFSPDGKTIVSGSEDKTIRLWNINGQPIESRLLGEHKGRVNAVAFSPNGQMIVSGSKDKTIRLWNISGQPIESRLLGKHKDSVTAVAFSPNGQMIVSGSEDKTIRLWDIEGGLVKQLHGHDHWIHSVAFSPNGQMIVSGSEDTTVRLWDIEGRPVGHPLRGHSDRVNAVAFSPDGQMIVSGSYDKKMILWAIINHNPIFEPLSDHQDSVNAVAFSPDGQKIVSGSSDKTLRLWNSNTGKSIIQPLHGHDQSVNAVAFSPDGQKIVSGSSDKTLRLWNSNTGESIRQPLGGHEDSVNAVAFSPNGQMIVSGSSDSTIRLWKIQGECIDKKSLGSKCQIFSVAFSPNGEMIATGSSDGISGGELCLWNINNNCITPLWRQWRKTSIQCVAFSPNGEIIATGSSDGKLRLWNIKGDYFEDTKPWDAHPKDNNDGVRCVAFSPDGQMIVTGGEDKVIRLWGIKGSPIGQAWSQHKDIVISVAFSPNGERMATGSVDKKIYLWRGGWREWLEICCKRLAPIILKQPLNDMNESCEICVRYEFWSSTDFAAILKDQGDSLAKDKQKNEAQEKFKKAKEYDHELDFEPEAKAEQQAALSLMRQIPFLAQNGQIKDAIQACKLIDDTLDPSTIPAYAYGNLCWFGSLQGYQDDSIVITACEKAVKFEESVKLKPYWRRTQGVAKALRLKKTLTLDETNSNLLREAIEDLYAYINDKNIHDNDKKQQCQRWIDALEEKKNPFTDEEEIKKLLIYTYKELLGTVTNEEE